MNWQIPLTDVTLGDEEAEAAAAVVRSGWLTQGEGVAAFEREFAAMVGAPHAVAVNNCTVGLELAYAAAGVVPGDEVIVPALTFVATANAARRLGATAVFADVTSADDLVRLAARRRRQGHRPHARRRGRPLRGLRGRHRRPARGPRRPRRVARRHRGGLRPRAGRRAPATAPRAAATSAASRPSPSSATRT